MITNDNSIITDKDIFGTAMVNENEYHLLIDDMKDLGVENVARTASQGKQMLRDNPVTHLYIDHDLGCKESGYDIVNWAIEQKLLPRWIQIVSHNPVGVQNIERALKAEGYVRVKNFWIK